MRGLDFEHGVCDVIHTSEMKGWTRWRGFKLPKVEIFPLVDAFEDDSSFEGSIKKLALST